MERALWECFAGQGLKLPTLVDVSHSFYLCVLFPLLNIFKTDVKMEASSKGGPILGGIGGKTEENKAVSVSGF